MLERVRVRDVGVLIGQGVSTIIAMPRGLKAAKILVPLDPRQPSARILQILVTVRRGWSLRTGRTCSGKHRASVRSHTRQYGHLEAAVPSDNLGLSIAGGNAGVPHLHVR